MCTNKSFLAKLEVISWEVLVGHKYTSIHLFENSNSGIIRIEIDHVEPL